MNWHIVKNAKKVVQIQRKDGSYGGYALVVGTAKGWVLLKANKKVFAKKVSWIRRPQK